jgi:hypothetical protein
MLYDLETRDTGNDQRDSPVLYRNIDDNSSSSSSSSTCSSKEGTVVC